MSRTRAYSQDTIAVIGRFFEALDSIIARKEIRGVQTYCRLYGIDKRHLYAQRNDLNRGFFEVSWILPLITKYGVSSSWLLFGTGPMFRPSQAKEK